MANDQSEEKTLPASRRKLLEARKKGQVARSKDLVAGVSLAGGLGLLVFGAGLATAACTTMLEVAGEHAAGDFAGGLHAIGEVVRDAVLRIALPFDVLLPALVVLSAMVMLRGIPFAVDPITPKADNLNPIEGFKRLFNLKALVELAKSVIKTLLLGVAVVVVLAGGLQTLLLLPACGMGCLPGALEGLAMPLLATAGALFLAAGVVDLGLQNWLFLREQKMGITEARRERKDTDGDPLIRRERRRQLREAARLPGGLGLRRATLVLHDGRQMAVALRFQPNDTPVPLVVARGSGARGDELLADAVARGVPMVEDVTLVAELFRRVTPGMIVPTDTYKSVAQALARARLV